MCAFLTTLASLAGVSFAHSQQPTAKAPTAVPPQFWAQAASKTQIDILQRQGTFSVQFRERRIDPRTDRTRVVIETRNGTVARLVERYGKPISAAENTAERQRLQDAADSPAAFAKHHKRDEATRDDAIGLLKLLPQAMIYTYAPAQPQLPLTAPQVVLDFAPDPAFKPPTMFANILTGLAGRIWIDVATSHVLHIEARVLQPVNFGWGVVARIAPGGTIELDQASIGNDRWMFTHLKENLTIRALMVKTLPQDTDTRATDFHPIDKLLGYQEAIKLLLDMPVPVN